ncbi:Phosphatase dcr2 [Malassezia sp. CBS 17886]|nr:Phosphatase dcr2 [Malassezia sp. CBS 17886]
MIRLRTPRRARSRAARAALGAVLLATWSLILVYAYVLTRRPAHGLASPRPWRRPAADVPRNATASSVPAPPDAPTDTLLAQSLARVNKYAPVRANVLPLVELSVGTCYVLFGCRPGRPAVPARSLAGDWVRVARPLSARVAQRRGQGGAPARTWRDRIAPRYLYYRRAYDVDAARIVDVRIVRAHDAEPKGRGWARVPTPIVPGRARRDLWYRVAAPRQHGDSLTEVDVSYGHHAPMPGFVRAGALEDAHASGAPGRTAATLLVRRGVAARPPTPQPTFRPDGTFTVLQIADLHFSVAELPCRDVADAAACASRNDTLALVNAWLDAAQPDLVAFTGDQLNGQGTSWDEKSVVPDWLRPVTDRKISWLPVFGNHDSESGFLTRQEQMELLAQYPYSLAQSGPRALHGVGNYDVPVRSPHADGRELLTLWSLDSGAQAPFRLLRPWQSKLYDWVHPNQIDWFLRRERARDAAPWPYRAGDAAATAASSSAAPAASARPPGILFVHIPVPEAFDDVDVDSAGRPMQIGVREERASRLGGQLRRGIFDAAHNETQNAPNTPGVRLFVHGHMHNNEDCRRVRGIWLCFGGGASYAAYGKVGFPRRARVYEVSEWGGKMATWHLRDDQPGKVNEMVLAGWDWGVG